MKDNCRLESDDTKNFLSLTQGHDGDIHISPFYVDEKGETVAPYVLKEVHKLLPPRKQEVKFRFRTHIGGGDEITNLLLRELIRRTNFLDEMKNGTRSENWQEQEKHFNKVFRTLIEE